MTSIWQLAEDVEQLVAKAPEILSLLEDLVARVEALEKAAVADVTPLAHDVQSADLPGIPSYLERIALPTPTLTFTASTPAEPTPGTALAEQEHGPASAHEGSA